MNPLTQRRVEYLIGAAMRPRVEMIRPSLRNRPPQPPGPTARPDFREVQNDTLDVVPAAPLRTVPCEADALIEPRNFDFKDAVLGSDSWSAG